MKKALLYILLSLSCYSLNAQRFGVKAGMNLSSFNGKDSKGSTSIVGYHIGGVVEFPVSYGFSIQPELLLSQKGAKYTGDLSSYDGVLFYDYTDKPLYVEIPVNAMFNIDSWTGRINILVGPYFAWGISGKRSQNSILEGENARRVFELFNTEYNQNQPFYKRFDFGVGASVGYEFANRAFVNLGTSLGLSNIFNMEHQSLRNFVVTLSVGYKFRQP